MRATANPTPTSGRVLIPARDSCPISSIENIAPTPRGASTSPAFDAQEKERTQQDRSEQHKVMADG
jgi:hypothetical protein